MKPAQNLILALSLTALVACSDSSTEPVVSPPSKSYNATVTGAVTKTLAGVAMFATDANEAGDSIFAVALGSPTSDDVLLLVREGAALPSAGAYPFVSPFDDTTSGARWTALYIMGDGEDLVGMFMADSGTLTISQASGQQVKATFQFEGTGFLADDFETERTISVSGSFDAGVATATASILSAARSNF